MMTLKIILILSFIIIFVQDIKEREVYWFLFPIIGVCSAVLLFSNLNNYIFYPIVFINIAFVLILILVVLLYSKLKLKTSIKNTFGFGDGLLFLALVFTFPSVSFLTLFVFSLIFSLLLHMLLKRQSKFQTVPLAGYISLFFSIIYLTHWFGFFPSIYTI